ncbi:MAG: GNAT family N-acetyltransferase [Endomicrobiales bacterium]
MIRLKEIHAFDDFNRLRDDWNRLLAESDNNCVFLTWEWVRAWWEVFGHGKELRILLGYADGPGNRLVGIAPFVLRKERAFGIPVRSIEFLGSGHEVTPDQLSFIALKGSKAEFINAVFDSVLRMDSWETVKLRDMRKDRELLRQVRESLPGRYRFRLAYRGVCPFIELPRAWEEYLAGLSSQNRYAIGRKERAISRKFAVEFSLLEGPRDLPQAIETLEALHKKRMQEKRMSGASLQKTFWEFHRKIAREFVNKGWLFVGMLKADGQVAACQYAFLYNNKVSFYQSGIDPDFGRYSVGLLSTAYMIRESIQRGLAEYDFLRGAEEYKTRWTRAYRENVELIIWNRTFRALFLFFLFHSRRLLGVMKRKAGEGFVSCGNYLRKERPGGET